MILFFILFLSRLIKWLSAINHDWSFYAHNSIISFLNGVNSPFMWLLWERIFTFEGWRGAFCDIFQKYTFIPKCLIIHCIFVFTIMQLLHKSLHTAQAWFHTGVHYWYICSPQTQHLSIILISNPNFVTENAFSLWFFCSFIVIQSLETCLNAINIRNETYFPYWFFTDFVSAF